MQQHVYAYPLHLGFSSTRIRGRNTNSNDGEIYQAIQQELDGSGFVRCYRAMWHTLRLDYQIQAPRRKVEGILQQVDPEGIALRKANALRKTEVVKVTQARISLSTLFPDPLK